MGSRLTLLEDHLVGIRQAMLRLFCVVAIGRLSQVGCHKWVGDILRFNTPSTCLHLFLI